MNGEKFLDITWKTIFKLAAAVIILYLFFLLKDIIIWFIFALIISILFNPLIDLLHKARVPRVLAVIFVYLGTFAIISLAIYSVVPLFADEIKQFSQSFPEYFEKILPSLKTLKIQTFDSVEDFLTGTGKVLDRMASNIFNTLFAIFGGIFSTLFVITLATFLSLEKKSFQETFALFFPKKYEAIALNIWTKTQQKVNRWFLVRVIACLFVGLATFLTLALFNIKYPLSLSLASGILNFVPIVGPIIIGIFIFIIIALESFSKALFFLLAFVIIQQIEGNILTPALSKKIIGISPALVLVALVVGGKLWGVLGAILAIPLFAIVFGFLTDFLKGKKEREIATSSI